MPKEVIRIDWANVLMWTAVVVVLVLSLFCVPYFSTH